MNVTAVVIVSVIAWAIVKIIRTLKSTNPHSPIHQDRINQMEQEINQLKERIVVLEQIVTDEKYDLKQKFKDLENDKVA